jgi:glucose-1-phosphate adenylyltransferase
MAKYLKSWYLNNPFPGQLHILEPRAGSYKGTADAVYQNLDRLWEYNADTILILAGDHVYKMDYRHMLAFHNQMKADVTMGVIPVPIEVTHRFGIVTIDSEGRVVDFIEKPRYAQSNLVCMGIYIFNKRALCKRLTEDANQPDSPHDFGYAIIPGMIKRGRVFAYKFNDYWRDIGTTDAFYEANMEVMSQQPPFSLNEKWPILTGEQAYPAAVDSESCNAGNSIVSPGCIIKGHVENSILSPGVQVEEKAAVRNSVLMLDVFVDYHSVVDKCIVDEQVNIGRFCYVGFGNKTILGEDDITVLDNGVVVPPHIAIGQGSKVLPHVGPSDFAASAIPSGSIVSRHPVAENNLVLERL